MSLGRKKRAELLNFACVDYSRCQEIRDFLQEQFPSKVIYRLNNVDGEASKEEGSPIDDYKNPMSAR